MRGLVWLVVLGDLLTTVAVIAALTWLAGTGRIAGDTVPAYILAAAGVGAAGSTGAAAVSAGPRNGRAEPGPPGDG